MAKKNYQRLSEVWNPNISSVNRDEFEIKFFRVKQAGDFCADNCQAEQ